MFLNLLVILGLIFLPYTAQAHGGLWMGQFPNWFDGVQWGFLAVVFAVIAGCYFLLKFILRRIKDVDILDHWHLRTAIKSKYYPLIFQLPALIVFAIIFYYLFAGSYYYSENPASILVWTFWWAILPFSFILVGRLWCAVCPFAWISDMVQKLFGHRRKIPLWLGKYSFWIIDATFILITWFDRVYGMTERPFVTGIILSGLLVGSVVFGFLYERRAFCRYVCFLGNVAGTYSLAAPVEFTSKDPEKCKSCKVKYCFLGRGGTAACPFSQVIPSKEGNRFCVMCANCVKSCPHDNVALKLRPFGSDFWKRAYVRFEESFFAKMLVGIVILQNIGMLTLWNTLSDFVHKYTGITNHTAVFTIIYFLSISIPLLLMFITSAISARYTKEKIIQNFARFGYSFAAVDLAGHLAHNLNHFLGEGKTVIAAVAGIFQGNVQQMIYQWLLNYGTVRIMQYAILIIGMAGTLIVTYKIAKRTAATKGALVKSMLPHVILLMALMAFNFYIFSLPMFHRS